MAARKRPARQGPSPKDQAHDDARLAEQMQLAHDAEMAAKLQEELDYEVAHELNDQLESLEMEASERRAAEAIRERLERKASKEVTHLGKATLKRIQSTLGVPQTLRGVLMASRDDAKFLQLLELVDTGQRDQVRLEIESLLLEHELVAML